MSHTPGPWTAVGCAVEGPFTPSGRKKFGIVCEAVKGTEEQARANAKLVAAAPDLLIACKEMREVSAHMMRFIADNVSTEAMMRFADSMENAAFAGFGVRAQDAILKAE